jgi:hypothetical protein
MKDIAETEKKIGRLIEVLDRDIESLQKNLSRLDQMRSAVIKRDDGSLGRILGELRTEGESLQMQEAMRKLIRKNLAEFFDCSYEDVTLTKLIKVLPAGQGDIIAEKKEHLRELAAKLKREYSATVFLMAECARFNRLMLNMIFSRRDAEAVIYDSAGSARRQSQAAFVNMKL